MEMLRLQIAKAGWRWHVTQIPTGKADALAGLCELMPEAGLADGFLAGVPGLRRAG